MESVIWPVSGESRQFRGRRGDAAAGVTGVGVSAGAAGRDLELKDDELLKDSVASSFLQVLP